MGKRELKERFKELDINIIDLLCRLDKTKNKKLMPFLLKEVSTKFSRFDPYNGFITSFPMVNEVEIPITYIITDILGTDNIKTFVEFSEHMENKRVSEMDINKYKTWDDIHNEVRLIGIKMLDKSLEKQISVIYSDDTWLCIKPLSLKSSLAYGSNTKWCTTMKNEPDYFYRYSTNGILIYTINKKTGDKIAFYCDEEGSVSTWNAKDQRIDSMQTNIPQNILLVLNEHLKNDKPNKFYFSDEEIENYCTYMKPQLKRVEFIGNEEPDMATPMGMFGVGN